MTLFIAAIAPAIILIFIFYKIDRFNREPVKLLLLLYILGMLSVIPILVVELILSNLNIFRFFDTDLINLYDALVVAGFTEELFKWAIVMVFAFKRKAFDEYLDGIIYCVFVSLGFATVENVLYVFEGSYNVAIVRSLLSVPAHMLFGVTMGYYISLAKFSLAHMNKSRNMALALTLPILLHGFYDYILMSRFQFLLLLLLPFVIWMWLSNMTKLKRYYNDSKYHSLIGDESHKG